MSSRFFVRKSPRSNGATPKSKELGLLPIVTVLAEGIACGVCHGTKKKSQRNGVCQLSFPLRVPERPRRLCGALLSQGFKANPGLELANTFGVKNFARKTRSCRFASQGISNQDTTQILTFLPASLFSC
jgi:hypothetical protein